MNILISCRNCAKAKSVAVEEDQYNLWKFGKTPLEEALPGLKKEEWNLLSQNVCPDCAQEE